MPEHKAGPPPELEAPKQPLMLESAVGRGARLRAEAGRAALVPLTYERAAFEHFRQGATGDAETQVRHDSLLTREQAEAINSHYDIVLNFGTHAFGRENLPRGAHPWMSMSTQREFSEVETALSGVKEGDTVFVESAGFVSQPPKAVTEKDIQAVKEVEAMIRAELAKGTASLEEGMFKLTTASIMRITAEVMAVYRASLSVVSGVAAQRSREHNLGSAWDYARFLAASKGVQVRYADYDAFSLAKAEQHAGKPMMDLALSGDIDDNLKFMRNNRQRELAARNAIKDWALANLPPEDAPTPSGQKPKLVLFFGAAHRDSMIEAFKQMGLNVTVNDLAKSTMEERVNEHMMRDFRRLFAEVMDSLGARIPDVIPKPRRELPATRRPFTQRGLGRTAGLGRRLGDGNDPAIQAIRRRFKKDPGAHIEFSGQRTGK